TKKKNLGFKLLPFLVFCAFYFFLWLPESDVKSAVIKCLPVLSLAFFVAAHSHSVGFWTTQAKRIFQGLLFSAVGDICLVWPDLFLPGMAAFGMCFICYTSAFGWRPFRPLTLLAVLGSASAAYILLVLPCLSGMHIYATATYTVLISIMAWRALSRQERQLNAAVGSVFFMVSDLLVGFNHFCEPLPFVRLLTMATYFIAQLLIALSVASQRVYHKQS
uniref:lysoplasmalogenase n=1 Tax=Salvator merianae TaxID=96440 RepID=A0A8D0B8W0_SALMN